MCDISVGAVLCLGGTFFPTTWHAVRTLSYLLLLSKFLPFPYHVVGACLKPTQAAVIHEVECQKALTQMKWHE